MWLMHTKKFHLQYFPAPPAEYAILSHVWGEREATFQDVQAGDNPYYTKLHGARQHAASEGLEWIWIDTCCIDKSNSTELSEAINSMFAWYAAATVCYVYLADVPTPHRSKDLTSSFRCSRWCTRGWTLQELIAPTEVRFLSAGWIYIGNKTMLAPLLEEVTGIPQHVLKHGDFSSVPVADRMSWASHRVTTRPEDEAYCLMGLFNVNIPIIYGEGRRAFRRLQEEIMRTSPDHTLFTWGPSIPLSSKLCLCARNPLGLYGASSNLLASAPSAFSHCVAPDRGSESGRRSSSPATVSYPHYMDTLRLLMKQPSGDAISVRSRVTHEIPEFTVTSYGIRARLPIIPLSSSLILQNCKIAGHDINSSPTDQAFLALLACAPQVANIPYSDTLTGLVLRRPPGSHVFRVGAWRSDDENHACGRYMQVTVDLLSLMGIHHAVDWDSLWDTVYIAQEHVPDVVVRPEKPLPSDATVRVVIPSHILGDLHKQRFIPRPPLHERPHTYHVPVELRSSEVISYIFHRTSGPSDKVGDRHDGFRIKVGLCGVSLWADVERIGRNSTAPSSAPPEPHGPRGPDTYCPRLHIPEWPSHVAAEEDWQLDRDLMVQWNYFRTFEVDGRKIHVRAASQWGVGVTGSALVVLGVEADQSTWDHAQASASEQSGSTMGRIGGLLYKSRSPAAMS
ncbi:heterokaryon incompatibility protein-domain-containing protein [Earliella scabrosa]|nr:heterokaryon incompatibility protein-domain-containing protein [Earliella scabrosa]